MDKKRPQRSWEETQAFLSLGYEKTLNNAKRIRKGERDLQTYRFGGRDCHRPASTKKARGFQHWKKKKGHPNNTKEEQMTLRKG